jgi:hypothetical protein
MLFHKLATLALFIVLIGCSDDAPGPDASPPRAAIYPADYAATYQEVRSCRYSLDHDLMRIRILVSPGHAASYLARTAPIPAGAIVLKEQFDEADTTCTGPIKKLSAMYRLDTGTSPEKLDWEWQETDPTGLDTTEDELKCSSCHYACRGGFDGTCAEPDPPAR